MKWRDSDGTPLSRIEVLRGMETAALKCVSNFHYMTRVIGEPERDGILPGNGFRKELDAALSLSQSIASLIRDELKDERAGVDMNLTCGEQ